MDFETQPDADRLSLFLTDETATEALGMQLAAVIEAEFTQPLVIYLRGDLGAGKTTFSRGFLRGKGHTGSVKSPTYTLVEPYEELAVPVFHFDLYRLADPEELEFLGFRDYLEKRGILLVEWPNRGDGYLPNADLDVNVCVATEASKIGRRATLTAMTNTGKILLERLVSSPAS